MHTDRMNFAEKLTFSRRLLAEAGVKSREIDPPPVKLLWLLRVPMPPAVLAPMFANFLVFGLFFFVGFFPSYFLIRRYLMTRSGVWVEVLIVSALVALFFGAWMAAHMLRLRIKYKLPTWSDIELEAQFAGTDEAKASD